MNRPSEAPAPAQIKVESGKVKLDIAKMKEIHEQQQREKGSDSARTDETMDTSERSHEESRKSKRPLSVDAGTRMTNDRPKKRKDESSELTSEQDKKALSSSSSDSVSPRESSKSKAPNVLDMLKAGVQPGQEKKFSLATPQFRLVSATGKMELRVNTTTASSSPYFVCIGCAADRRILGLLKDPLVITGRSRIAEVETFILQIQEKGRKMVIPFVLFTHKGQAASSVYGKLCDEFTQNNRVGFCQMAPDLQAYLVPPALKRHLSLLKEYTVPSGSEGAGRELYGVLVAREAGSIEFTSAPTMELNVMAPPEPLAPSPVVESSKTSEKPKSAVVSDSSAPSTPPTFVPVSQPSQPPAAAYKGPTPTYSTSTIPPPPVPPSYVPPPPPPTFALPRPSAPIPAPIAAPVPVPVSAPAPPVVQTPPLTTEMLAMIHKVADFCAKNGAQTIQMLRGKENASILMPFIFPGQTGHQEFLHTLQAIVNNSDK